MIDAQTFDPAGVHLIEALLRRADALGGAAGARLRERASARSIARANDLALATRRAEGALAEQLARPRAQSDHDVAHAAQRAREARSGYERTRDRLLAAIEIARALDTVSEVAGPYNPLSLAARALTELAELAPSYLHAQMNRLEDLGALLALPPERPARSRRPRK